MKVLSKTVFPKESINFPNTFGLLIAENKLGSVEYKFDTQFMHLVRYALSSDCISEFTDAQESFFLEWISYKNALVNNSVTYPKDSPIIAFDQALVDLSECINRSDEIVCGNSVLHVYTVCVF